jgi:sphingolipid 8-(E)-desaturase
MKAYRIGRKPAGPWINMTPPIRGGIYQKEEISNEIDVDTDGFIDDSSLSASTALSDQSSLTSECSTNDEIAEKVLSQLRERRRPKATHATVLKHAQTSHGISLSPTAYADLTIQDEVNRGLREYPSIDPSVQQEIVNKYRALHQRVQDEGYYDCPYLEYGKEMIRYVTLFATSMTALHFGWYMTSAVFLGLFWVGPSCFSTIRLRGY